MLSTRIGFLVSVLVLANACRHTYEVHTVVPHEQDNAVVTSDGRRFTVRPVSGGWVTSTGKIIKPEQVQSKEGRNHTRGALEGIGLGLAIGTHVGAILGSMDSSCDRDAYQADPVCGPAIGGALVGLATGALLLGVIGGTRGSKIVHRRSTPRIQVAPTTGGMSAQLAWQL